jgi:hypothetical protein
MPRIICAARPAALSGYPESVVLDSRFLNQKMRQDAERLGVGHLYIPDDIDLSKDMLVWINRLEDSLDWHIYASSSQMKRLKPSLKREGQ